MNDQYSPPKSVRLIRSVSVWKKTRIFHLKCFIFHMKVHELIDVIQWEIYSEMFSKIFIIVNFDVFLFLFEFCDFLSVVQFYRLKFRQLVPIYSILCICYTAMSYSIRKFDFKMFFYSVIFYPGYTFFIQWWWVFFFLPCYYFGKLLIW